MHRDTKEPSRIRHLIRLPGRAGGPPRYYWQPSSPLRAAGWRSERLPDDVDQAKARASQLNQEVDAWRRGELPANAPATAAARARQEGAAGTPGSVSALIQDYKQSRFWTKLAPRTQRGYEAHLATIEAWAGPEPVEAITPPVIQRFYEAQLRRHIAPKLPELSEPLAPTGAEWMPIARYAALRGLTRDAIAKAIRTGSLRAPHKRKEGDGRGSILIWADAGELSFQATAPSVINRPASAAALIRVLRLLLQAGERLGYVQPGANPASRPGISVERQREPQLWSSQEACHMAAVADEMGYRSIGTAILLNEWIGQREADVLLLPPWKVEAEALKIRQAKRRRWVILPVYLVPHLVERLRLERERQGVVLSAEFMLPRDGTERAWTEDAFRYAFAQIRANAAKAMPRCALLRFAELRHTAVTRLDEAGVSDMGIAGITGHSPKTVREILDRHYLVRTEKSAVLAFRKRLEKEAEEG